jgi:hypothetical protein
MPCYDYLTTNSSLFTNTEVTLPISGTTYSYNSLYWICNYSVSTQLKVFKKNSTTSNTVQLILNTDFTINETNATINITASLVNFDQIVLQRSTLSDRMITNFSEGAKLTAKDLNDCFYQLLFVTQEKDFTNSTVNVNYSLATAVSAWVNGTSYTIGSIVSYNNKIYKCIQATSSIDPTNVSFWTMINPTLNGFYITGTNSSLEFDFSNLQAGHAIIWNGTKFVSNAFSGSISNLSDVDTTPVANKDILVYDTSNPNGNKWTAKSPTVDITVQQLIFADRTFYPSTNLSWHNVTPLNISSINQLGGFKNNSNQWVVTDPPTVYHIIKKILPAEEDPVTYFTNVTNSLEDVSDRLSNPVKIKLEWNLNQGRINTAKSDGFDNLGNYKSMYWNKPNELYSASGYNLTGPLPLVFHGVQSVDSPVTKVYTSPYFNRTTVSTSETSYTSKLYGYGIAAFYLSVPECYTTTLKMPIFSLTSGEEQLFYLPVTSGSNLDTTGISNAFNSISAEGGTFNNGNVNFKDFYLLHLRDMCFAGVRQPGSYSVSASPQQRDKIARLMKNYFIAADYNFSYIGNSSTSTINYKRLETAESAIGCMWKIPATIIYYNKQSLAMASTAEDSINTSNSFTNEKPTVRFQGWNRLQKTENLDSTTSNRWEGLYVKADKLWTAWQQRWLTENANTYDYRFNEADMDWFTSNVGVVDASTLNPHLDLYRQSYDYPSYTVNGYLNGYVGISAHSVVPWAFRPNDIHAGGGLPDNAGYTGVYQSFVDQNAIFSNAHNFVPNPEDEYVFRVVAKKGVISNYFIDALRDKLKSSIILEYGLTDNANYQSRVSVSSVTDIYKTQYSQLEASSARVWSKTDLSKLKVYIKNESVETYNNDTRYVITLAIRVPRLKSLGYSKVYRKFSDTDTGHPQRDSTADDTEIDSGPWGFTLGPITGATTPVLFGTEANNKNIRTYDAMGIFTMYPETGINAGVRAYGIADRVECAVKFTNLGIPSNLWIRLSVLNTDGTLALINSGGFNSLATQE